MKKRSKVVYTAVMVVLIAVPALVLSVYVGKVAGPYINQPTGVIVRPAFPAQQSHYYINDGEIGHIHRPNVRFDVSWEEHPAGRVVMETNNLGFREDRDTDEEKGDDTVRILVTGDSHIDGVVNNSEAFPNRLEALLNVPGRPAKFEVINGGTGYFGPQHYCRFIRKYDYLDPDAFIVVIYTGNDFLDAIRIESRQDSMIAAGRDFNAWTRLVYFGRLAAARGFCHGATSQELNQAFFFKRFPEMKQVSLTVTKREIGKIRDKCRSGGTDLYLVLLPTRWFVEGPDMGWQLRMARLVLWLSKRDLRVTREITDSLAIWLDRSNIDYIDLADCADADPDRQLFWGEDSHLNVYGHRVMAEQVHGSFDWSSR